jgi:hypothetical protein
MRCGLLRFIRTDLPLNFARSYDFERRSKFREGVSKKGLKLGESGSRSKDKFLNNLNIQLKESPTRRRSRKVPSLLIKLLTAFKQVLVEEKPGANPSN